VIQLDAAGVANYTAADIDNGSSASCGPVMLSASPTSFDCSQIGTNTVTLTVEDDFGNSSTCTAVVTVEDNTSPLCIAQNITGFLDATGQFKITAQDIDNGSSDNCAPVSLEIDDDTFDCSDIDLTMIVEEWSRLGFNILDASVPDLLVNSQDEIIVIYKNNNGAGPAAVVSDDPNWNFRGTNGSNFGNGNSNSHNATINDNDEIYVIRTDVALANRATVSTFDGTTWQVVGNPGFTPGTTSSADIIADNNNVYVIFRDGANNDQTSVMTFDGINWVNVGQPGFSIGPSNFQSLGLNSQGVLYAAYSDDGLLGQTVVMMFDGTTWIQVGSNISPGASSHQELFVDSNDNLYVAFADDLNGGLASVKRFDGTNWVNVGPAGFSSGMTTFFDMVESMGRIYIAYRDAGVANQSIVQFFDGSIWQTIGQNSSSLGFPSVSQDLEVLSNGELVLTFNNVNQTRLVQVTTLEPNTSLNNVNLLVTDQSGNTSVCSSTVTVLDNLPPICNSQNITVSLTANGTYSLAASEVDNGSSDNCSVALSVAPSIFDCTNLGANTVTLTATDLQEILRAVLLRSQ
jgi:hypothetical protein